jgi:single-strand DNA-binding protein
MNLAILRGRLGADPEISYTQSGTPKALLRLATSKRWTDKASGEKREQTQWHRVVLWERQAEIAGRYLAKGKEVLVTGEIQTRAYTDQHGRQAYITEIIARELELIGGRDAGAGGTPAETTPTTPTGPAAPRAPAPGTPPATPAGAGQRQPNASAPAQGYSDVNLPFDDDIPF